MKTIRMALVYDFDKTLSPKDMQEFHLLPSFGYKDPADFWAKCKEYSDEYNIDGILSYMYLLAKEDPEMTKAKFNLEGKKYIKFYPGVKDWFERINAYGKEKGVIIEHYIISSGVRDIIGGTEIAKHFKKIYACSYYYDEEGKIKWPARVVNYTTKTQYLYRINKGVLDERNDIDLNRSMPEEDKYIPFPRLIYFGDGLTDVPSMKTVKQHGGQTIAVYSENSSLAQNLQDRESASYVAKADYRKGSKIEKIVMNLIDKVAIDSLLEVYR